MKNRLWLRRCRRISIGLLTFILVLSGLSPLIGVTHEGQARQINFAATVTEEVEEEESVELEEENNDINDDALPPIEEGYFRLHFATLPEGDQEQIGLWLWGDVATTSEEVAGWPDGATSAAEFITSAYGYYIDIEVADSPTTINYLFNNLQGENLTEDQSITILSSEMKQVWIDEEFEQHIYEPIEDEGLLRVNYFRTDGEYDDWALWSWGDVITPSEELADWPDGALEFTEEGPFGRYIDLEITDLEGNIEFLLVNQASGEQTGDMSFADRAENSQIFLRDEETTVYMTPFEAGEVSMTDAELISTEEISVNFSTTSGLSDETAIRFKVTDSDGNDIEINDVQINNETNQVMLTGEFDEVDAPYTVTYNDDSISARMSWRIMDELYAYDGDLGVQLNEDGSALLKVWAPTADKVSVVLYDKNDQNTELGEYEMTLADTGVWSVELTEDETELADHTGYFYHYSIERNGDRVLALDPYAPSLAAWDNTAADNDIAKAAIVDPSKIGPELNFAEIPAYEKAEDAIIYEVHIRDFTSDPSIEDELTSRFGSFSAFVERLDYIESLGVTHIQLLPVMSYYHGNELENDERELEWSSTENNYNWGYDPQSYFALTGMYSENPEDPAQRIEEFKNLVDEIHARDMGVILDVVYNHTAQTHIFEALEPNYYHFMDLDGTPREAYGGGRLGTTHHMARRILVDSIAYWVDEYKVDGFRFDLMGDHDAESIQRAADVAKALNPNIFLLGEGWVTFAGDEGDLRQPADQSWMDQTDDVAVFSDEIRNMVKSGFGGEGEPRFITGGPQNIADLYQNIIAQPSNTTADDPGDIIQYIAAHDNLTLHDVIAMAIQKDPTEHAEEIHQRIRLGNALILTSQGTPFIHAGQEFGRTKQFRHEDFIEEVPVAEAPYKSTFMVDEADEPFVYPYFIHDSYDSSDTVNMINWEMALDEEAYPEHVATREYTTDLIALRREVDAFRWGTQAEVEEHVRYIDAPEIDAEDVVIAYEATSSDGNRYAVFINADTVEREFTLEDDFASIVNGEIIGDAESIGADEILEPVGVELTENSVVLAPLTVAIIRYSSEADVESEILNEFEELDTPELNTDVSESGTGELIPPEVETEPTEDNDTGAFLWQKGLAGVLTMAIPLLLS